MFTQFSATRCVHKQLAIYQMTAKYIFKGIQLLTSNGTTLFTSKSVKTQRVLDEGIHEDVGEHLTHRVKTTQFVKHPQRSIDLIIGDWQTDRRCGVLHSALYIMNARF